MERFSCDGGIVTGSGAISVLSELTVGRLLVVTDPYFHENGIAQRIAQGAAPEAVEYFSKIVPDPSVTLAAEGTAAVKAFRPDTILALGGGSAMDCAKAMAYFSGSDARLIAVPTTSGSGSEVTDFAILTHDGVKHPLVDPRLRPCLAIADPDLVSQLPKALIADGGYDIVTHAIEAYGAKNAGAFTDALAQEAFRTCLQELVRSFNGDLGARAKVHIAATMAGLAFTNAGLGLCHALSHGLGGAFHLPHGRLNAIVLPSVLTHSPSPKYAALARGAGLEGQADTLAVRNLRSALIRLRRELGLPATLAEAGIPPAQVREQTEAIVTAALEDPCCATAPVPVTRPMVLQILKEITGHG